MGLVLFNHNAHVAVKLTEWTKTHAAKIKDTIKSLKAGGSTNLSAAAQCATDLYKTAGRLHLYDTYSLHDDVML